MIRLDWIESTGWFRLDVPRGEADPQKIVQEEGWDLSVPASSAGTAVLMTREPYAAAAYGSVALPAARLELGALLAEIEASWRKESDFKAIVPADKILWPFQVAGVEYATRRRNTLIADQPGLGKTAQAISYCNTVGAKRVLVVCPAAIRLQWCKAIREWSTRPWPYHVYAILGGRSGVHPTAAWTVVSYDLARSPAIGAALAAGLYDVLILDEAHYLKTIDAGRTRAVFGGGEDRVFAPLAGRCGSILALTGTPLPNRPREAYTLARGLCFDSIDWMSEEKFQERFNPSMTGTGQRENGETYIYTREEAGRASELQNRLRANFMVRRLKREVMPQLHMPVYDLITVDETSAVKQALAAESLLHIDPDDPATFLDPNGKIDGHIAVARRMMGIAIAPQVAEYVDMLIDGGEEKLVVFGWHIEVLDILEAAWRQHGVLRIDGSTSMKQREKRVSLFRTDPRAKIMLGNIQSMGTGVDGLQDACYHGLIAEPSWTPGENIQAFERLDRIGQSGHVQGDIFVAPRSVAERVLASALRKLKTTTKVLDQRRT